MERLRTHFYASLLEGLAYLKIRYESLHIELCRQSGHYYLLISSNYIQGYRVEDLGIVEAFSKAVAKLLNKKYREPYWSNADSGWRVYYRSKAFHKWYRKQTLDTLKNYIEYNRDTSTYFLRGLYDSEGYNYRCRGIFLSNNDVELLKYVQYLLKRYFGIIATGPYLHAMAGNIHTKRNGETIKTNHNNYYIAISRKQYFQPYLGKSNISHTLNLFSLLIYYLYLRITTYA